MSAVDWLFLAAAGVIPPLGAGLAALSYFTLTRRVARRLGWPVALGDSAHIGLLITAGGIALGSWLATPHTLGARGLVVLAGGIVTFAAGLSALVGLRRARRAVALEGQCPMVP